MTDSLYYILPRESLKLIMPKLLELGSCNSHRMLPRIIFASFYVGQVGSSWFKLILFCIKSLRFWKKRTHTHSLKYIPITNNNPTLAISACVIFSRFRLSLEKDGEYCFWWICLWSLTGHSLKVHSLPILILKH